MARHDHTIKLPEFKGEVSEDPEKHLFICEKIWEAKHITYEENKIAQLDIVGTKLIRLGSFSGYQKKAPSSLENWHFHLLRREEVSPEAQPRKKYREGKG
jgi:hypothetical protein